MGGGKGLRPSGETTSLQGFELRHLAGSPKEPGSNPKLGPSPSGALSRPGPGHRGGNRGGPQPGAAPGPGKGRGREGPRPRCGSSPHPLEDRHGHLFPA